MSLSRRPPTKSKRPASYGRGGPPAWMIFILAIATVFGMYYIWLGVRDYIDTSGMGIRAATTQAVIQNTATALQIETDNPGFTPLPTSTPLPSCQDFAVEVEAAVVRSGPSTSSTPLNTLRFADIVCVIQREGETEWYLIDTNTITRRIETGYIRDDLVRALNPTPTPTNTFTPAPTVTEAPTDTPTMTVPPTATYTPDPDVTNTPIPTETPLPTPTTPLQSA